MQNIDPFLFIEPVVFIAISAGLILYWRLKRRFVAIVLLFSFIAYAGAIALKEIVQAFTAGGVTAAFGSASWQTGVYYGVQTSVFEVGLTYLVARYAISRKMMEGADGEAYGISLAFWENGVLLGALTLFNLVTTYFLIAGGLIPASVYQTIVNSEPSVFYSPQQLALPMAFGVLERISSLLAHFSWGYLCVLAVYMRRRAYFLVALPMGLLDVTVPFAQEIPLWEYETLIFAISLGFFLVAWTITRGARRSGYAIPPPKD
ncbi:MAG: YhfC family glutamic-type intramembrane protease [Nitrososphaerales archaeon]|jgi:hypothetical protein